MFFQKSCHAKNRLTIHRMEEIFHLQVQCHLDYFQNILTNGAMLRKHY
jgi:hypothetical protein